MRLTNPTDQGYVQRLLPDNVRVLTDSLSSLEQREALILGDAVVLPSLIVVNSITHLPASTDVHFKTEWAKDWYATALDGVIHKWRA